MAKKPLVGGSVVNGLISLAFTLYFASYCLEHYHYPNGLICATDSLSYTPYPYATPEELEAYLRFPTAINVSRRFGVLIWAGMVINFLCLLKIVVWACFSMCKQVKLRNARCCCEWFFICNIAWWVHFGMMVYHRLLLR